MKRRHVSIGAKPDGLSSLPDSVLSHILSFIPTENSVLTSVLARRWRYLWRDVPNFEFNLAKYMKKRPRIRFEDTVNRVLLLSNVQNINSFRLILEDPDVGRVTMDGFMLESWIMTAIAKHVQALHIQLEFYVRVHSCIFTCETLVDLELHCCGPVPGAIYLPNLKRLHLQDVDFENDEKLQGLISGCPALEELTVKTLIFLDLSNFIVSSPTIKRLTLNLYLFDLNGDYKDYYFLNKLEINTPALRYLYVGDHFSKCISTGTFNSLVEANISLDGGNVPVNDIYSNSVLELIEKVGQVKCLTLSIGNYQFPDASFVAATPKFINLTRLELNADWSLLLKFLENADNLQILIIRQVYDNDLKRWTEPQQVPTCLSSKLRQVTIDDFKSIEVEFEIVSYILRTSKVLKVMEIITRKSENMTMHLNEKYTDLKKEFDALKRISAFERRSETCKLQFS